VNAPTNVDLLAWFGEDERQECSTCAERARVTLPNAAASFCLACGAVTIDGAGIAISAEPAPSEPVPS
jgi:hypothetical protein